MDAPDCAQQVLGLSDVISDVFQAESALLRTLKARAAGTKVTAMSDLALVFVNDAVGRMEQNARTVLAAVSEGDELRSQLGIVRRLLRWSPLNTVARRRRIAQRLSEVGNYPALIAEK